MVNTIFIRIGVIPGTLKKGTVEILSIGTSMFKWSSDKKWMAFIVHPTASWSLDSNMLCILSSDGKTFEPVDEIASGFPFNWAPTKNLLGYIEGGGRMVFGFKNKNLKINELPALHSLFLTPKNLIDLDFTWENQENVIVSRSNEPAQRILPTLFKLNIQNKAQKQISFPPSRRGDFNPVYLPKNDKLVGTRSNWKEQDLCLSKPDGSLAKEWIENIDYGSVSLYDPK